MFALSAAAIIAVLIAAYYTYALTRPPTILTLDIEKYSDNQELYGFALRMKSAFMGNKPLEDCLFKKWSDEGYETQEIYKRDKRVVEIISAGLRQREGFLSKRERHFGYVYGFAKENVRDLSKFPSGTFSYIKGIFMVMFYYELKDINSPNIQRLSFIVGQAGLKEVSGVLVEVANDSSLTARVQAIHELARLEGRNAIPHLRKLLKDKDEKFRYCVGEEICGLSTVDDLRTMVQEDRSLALTILRGILSARGTWNTDECAKFMFSMLSDRDPVVKAHALLIIDRYNHKGCPGKVLTDALMDIICYGGMEIITVNAKSLAAQILAEHLYANEKIKAELKNIHKGIIEYRHKQNPPFRFQRAPESDPEKHDSTPAAQVAEENPAPLSDNDAEKAIGIFLGQLDGSPESSYYAIGILKYLTCREEVYKKILEKYSAAETNGEMLDFLEALACSRRPEVFGIISERMDKYSDAAKCFVLYGDRRGLAEIMKAIRKNDKKYYINTIKSGDLEIVVIKGLFIKSLFASYLSLAGPEGFADACKENPDMTILFFSFLASEKDARDKFPAESIFPLLRETLGGGDKSLRLASLWLIESYGAISGPGSGQKLKEILEGCLKDNDPVIKESARKIAAKNGLEVEEQ